MKKENNFKSTHFFKNITLLSLMLYGSIIYAQKFRFYYELRFTPNSSQKEIRKVDFYILDYDTKTNESSFYSSNYVKNDSINKKINSLMKVSSVTVNLNGFKNSFIKEIITKRNDVYNIYSTIDGDFYTYQQEAKNTWKLGSENLKVLDYNCKSADISFGGRNWKAYFTNELPFNSGPYKFGELPGLITKIYDTEKEFEFSLIGVTKIDESVKFNFSKYIKVNEDKYIKQYESYLKDPVKSMKQGTIITDDGTKFVMAGGFSKSEIENEKKEIYSRLSKDNNCLERDSKKCKVRNSILNSK
ncbi:GLPGLI family protein [Chryseobacterium sp. SIMBA_028]|uniref:GLPGLI family protein n=1 Tax=Chryseobacterium sp. SIMBA_028 TaxID=3085771 RepID=UPI00397820EE